MRWIKSSWTKFIQEPSSTFKTKNPLPRRVRLPTPLREHYRPDVNLSGSDLHEVEIFNSINFWSSRLCWQAYKRPATAYGIVSAGDRVHIVYYCSWGPPHRSRKTCTFCYPVNYSISINAYLVSSSTMGAWSWRNRLPKLCRWYSQSPQRCINPTLWKTTHLQSSTCHGRSALFCLPLRRSVWK